MTLIRIIIAIYVLIWLGAIYDMNRGNEDAFVAVIGFPPCIILLIVIYFHIKRRMRMPK